MPATEELKIPHQFGEIPPPGKPGDGKARPVRKISSLPEIGTVVVQVLLLLLNEVVAQLALGLKTITPLGTADENALDVTVEPQNVMVAPLLGILLALIWALNHMVSPAGIAAPLKFDWIHDCARRTRRSRRRCRYRCRSRRYRWATQRVGRKRDRDGVLPYQ